MDLLTLPPELLGRIIEFSMPHDFENFMMTCRAVYACGQSSIAIYNSHKQRWAQLHVRSTIANEAAWKYLGAIAMEPVAVEYIQSVEYHCVSESRSDGVEPLRAGSFSHPQFSMETVKTLVHQSPHMQTAAHVWDLISRCDESFRCLDDPRYHWQIWELLLLVSQLENVEILTLRGGWEFLVAWDVMAKWNAGADVIEVIFFRRLGFGDGPSLAKLKTLRIFDSLDRYARLNSDCLSPILLLPNLEQLSATGLAVIEKSELGSPLLTDASLRELELISCCMDGDSIKNLLEQTPLLRSFRYSQRSEREGTEHDWNAAAFVAAVGRCCGHGLVSLCIAIDELNGRITNGVTSLKDFVCLEHAELEVGIFAGPSLESLDRSGTTSQSAPSENSEWTVQDVPKLVEILPPSIKNVGLFHGCLKAAHYEVGISLLKDFSAGRDWLLSDLEELSYTQLLPAEPDAQEQLIIEKLKEQAERAGASYIAGTALRPVWRRSAGSHLDISAQSRPILERDYFL